MKFDMTAWRTFAMGALALAAVLVAIWLKATDASVKELSSMGWLIVSAMAARSAVESLAEGGGLRGATKVLMTDAKPGSPP